MDKLQIINDSISEIRDILDADCANITELPELVRVLKEDPSRNGFTTVFVFSSLANPGVPTAKSLNTSTGLIADLDSGWSQTGFQSTSVYQMRNNIVEDADFNWMSFAIFDPSGNKVTDWAVPTNLKGSKGAEGKIGADGKQGEQGLPGERGDAGISYRTVSVYTTTDSIEDIPNQPKGGHWDMKTNTVSLPVSEKTRWYLNINDEYKPKKFVWTSNTTFGENGNPISEWSVPFRITGEDGKNGADGRVIEFIYRQVPDYETFVQLRNYLDKPENKLPSVNESDVVPDVNDNLNIGTPWTDRPEGISQGMQIEVVCSRVRKNLDSPWEDWSQCRIWSKWGEDGQDGDGIEYIYLVTPDKTNTGEKMTSEYVKTLFVPVYDINNESYQTEEFCFNDDWGFVGYDWTDEPRDVGPGKPMEWVMVRKQQNNTWQAFSDPALWATYSEDGVSYITSFVFTRASKEDSLYSPQGGSFMDPRPDNRDIWEDSIPSGTLPVWMSTRTFCSISEYSDDDWSTPKMIGDTPGFQVEYSADLNVSGDKLIPFTGNEDEWRALQYEKYSTTWGDDETITDPIWMITSTLHEGIWSQWTLSKIKGEKGDKGDPGTSVSIKHKVKTKQELLDEWNDYIEGGFFFTSADDLVGGEGVYVDEEGLLYVYSGGYYYGEDTDFDLYWQGIEVKGEPGDSAYIYIRFTDGTNSTAQLFENTPKKYIGFKYSTTEITDPSILNSYNTYTWSQWRGEDGWGQEQIFLLTSEDLGFNPETNHLPLPINNDKTVSEYLPVHSYGTKASPSDKWSDTPLTPDTEYPYCWVATRKGQGNSFGDWIGYDNKASLYSRYSYDGVSSVFVDLSNDLAVIPMEEGKIDPDFKDTVTTNVRVYVGDEQVSSEDFTVTGEKVTISGPTVTLNLNDITEDIKEIPLTVTFGKREYTIIWHILQTDTAYELIPNVYTLKRYSYGNLVGQLVDSELSIDVWKWTENKWHASNVPVFAKITYLNGSSEILSTSDGKIDVTTNGHTTVHLSGLLDIASIKIYVVQPDSNGNYMSNGTILSFETITIVADGIPGKDGGRTVFVYTISTSNDSYINAPQGGTLDLTTNVVTGIVSLDTYSWSMNPPVKIGEYKYVWQSIGNFNGSGILIDEWSQPICITGANGADGADGTNVEFIYRLLPDKTVYTQLKEHLSKNPLENTATEKIPSSAGDGFSDKDWTDEPSGIDSTNYRVEVMCSRKANIVDGKFVNWKPWSEPSFWSMWGEDGKDGPGLQYVFKITTGDVTDADADGHLANSINDVNFQNDKFTPVGWTDEPQDVDATEPLEWVSTRKKIDGVWKSYSAPTVWGKYTTDGLSFKTSYVFARATNTPNQPEGGNWDNPIPDLVSGIKIWHDTIPIDGEGEVWMSYRMFRDDDVEIDDWTPPTQMTDTNNFEVIYGTKEADRTNLPPLPITEGIENVNGWYDNAVEGIEFWYMATATYRNSEWSSWTISQIKGEKGDKGESKFVSTVFKRYAPTEAKPIPDKPGDDEGSYDSPVPEGWEDGIPDGTDPIWETHRQFGKDGASTDKEWSKPIMMSDSPGFEVIYNTSQTLNLNMYPSNDFYKDEDGGINGWLTNSKGSNNISNKDNGWTDDPTGNNSIWMATTSRSNGNWSNWTVTKIKGEKGEDGKSVTIKGNFNTEKDLREAFKKFINNEADKSGFNLPLVAGDGYLVEGDLYVYDGDGVIFEDAWTNVGQIKGEPGTSKHLYIRYSPNRNGNPVLEEGKVGKYIGIKISDVELDADQLKDPAIFDSWSKWQGDDGWGWEQVFISTKDYVAPYIESSDSELPEADLINKGWSDKPISVDDNENQYIWYLFRKSNDTWKGTVERDNKIYAALYDRWSSDGQDALIFELSDDQIVVPIEKDGTVDVDYAGTLENSETMTITLSLYKGASELPYNEVEYSSDQSSFVSIINNVATIKLANLASVDKIVFSAKHNGKTRTKICHVIKTANAYELSSDTIVIRRGKDGFPERGVTFYPKKWNGQTWSNCAGETLYFTYSYVDGTFDDGDMSINGDTVNWPLNLKSEKFVNLTNIHAYMTIGGYEVFEDVAVVADGLDGDSSGLEDKIKEAVLTAAQENIDTALTDLREEITNAETELNKTLMSGVQNDIAAATANLATQTAVLNAVENLEKTYFTNEGKLQAGALKDTDIYNLSIAALGKDVPEGYEIPEGEIHADSYFGRYMASAVGVFGDLFADRLEATTIKADKISGGTLDVGNININGTISVDNTDVTGILTSKTAKTEIGKIVADEITASTISTNVLKTYGSDNEGITIEGDDVIVHKKDTNDPVMTITGNEFDVKIPSGFTQSGVNVSGSDNKVYWNKLGSISKGYNYTIDVTNPTSFNCSLTASCDFGYNSDAGYTVWCQGGRGQYSVDVQLIFIKKGLSTPSDDKIQYGSNQVTFEFPINQNGFIAQGNSSTTFNATVKDTPSVGISWYTWDGTSMMSTSKVPNGDYDVYLVTSSHGDASISTNPTTNNTSMSFMWGFTYGLSISLNPILATTVFSSNGMCYAGDYDKYFIVKQNGEMIIRNGNNGFGVDDKGPFFVKNDKKYYFDGYDSNGSDNWITGTEDDNIDWTKYQ